jgi:hypothetical protein
LVLIPLLLIVWFEAFWNSRRLHWNIKAGRTRGPGIG